MTPGPTRGRPSGPGGQAPAGTLGPEPGYDGAGYVGPGYDGPGYDGPAYGGPGYGGPGYGPEA
ncbi:hypothetical protein PSU4_56080 [Pseudonocardia sulfidoxydans NBRC 16205]|uniref:Uncharacterized protein n=1 Tax=Pseudonocardia sulfidoxydans NBRC 16205 TaxID=1223511 RepID=A0A511DSC7_9PSEU|nr:hypothetical protein PSU4_56080 [Pseudonocardia sulfidoxydans NBRC 16205]